MNDPTYRFLFLWMSCVLLLWLFGFSNPGSPTKICSFVSKTCFIQCSYNMGARIFFRAPKTFPLCPFCFGKNTKANSCIRKCFMHVGRPKNLQNMKPCSTPRNSMDWTTWFDSLNTSIVLQNKGKASINGTMVIVCIVSRKYCPQLSISIKFYGKYLSKSEATFRLDVNTLHFVLAEPRPSRRVTTSTQR